jgi:hypothetical protein
MKHNIFFLVFKKVRIRYYADNVYYKRFIVLLSWDQTAVALFVYTTIIGLSEMRRICRTT